MTITVRIIVEELSSVRFSAAFALYVGEHQLFPFETLDRTFDRWMAARAAVSDAAAEKIDELRRAECEFEIENR